MQPASHRQGFDGDGRIVVSEVVKRYAGERDPALRGVTFTVEPGELVAIAGPSGSGKSTLVHLLGALDHPDAGSIVVDGFDIGRHTGVTRFRRQHVGIVFQLHNLLPHLDAATNLEIAMYGTHANRSARRARARELLAAVGLADKADEVPPRLSGGERQRVAIARAFVNNPRVILADEPTGSLDDESTGLVLARFREHLAGGGTLVCVTHDPRVLAVSERTLTLAAGRITDDSATSRDSTVAVLT